MKNFETMVDDMQTELLSNIHKLRAMADAYEVAYEKIAMIRTLNYTISTEVPALPKEIKLEAPIRDAKPVGQLKEKPKKAPGTRPISELVRAQMDIYYQSQQEFTMKELIADVLKDNAMANYNNVVNAYTIYYKNRNWEPLTYKNENKEMVYKLIPAIK